MRASALLLLLTGCARTVFGSGEPFQPWARAAAGVSVEQRGETLVLRPTAPTPVTGVLLFLHGFASRPAQYQFTLEHLAARGFVVFAPTLPDYFIGRIGYHRSVLNSALAAYDQAASQATLLHMPAPGVIGYSMGGGAALLVGAQRRVPTVLWAPVPLDLDLVMPTAPLLMLEADHDCIAKGRPAVLAQALGTRGERVVIAGNHLGFTDISGGERWDCPSPVTRNAQREEAVERSVAFFKALSSLTTTALRLRHRD